MRKDPMNILLVDDDEEDFLILKDLLSEVAPWEKALDWVDTYDAALKEIGLGRHDVYLLDYQLGSRNGLELLREAVAGGCRAPMIFLSGHGDEELDAEAIKAGAMDYLVKGMIDASILERSIRYAIERKGMQDSQEKLINELQKALAQVKTLSGMLPICAWCKNVRDDKGYWKQIEMYIAEHSSAEFSHSLCPDCREKNFGKAR